MDCKLIWSPDALADIEAIGDYISRDSEFYAESTALNRFTLFFPVNGIHFFAFLAALR